MKKVLGLLLAGFMIYLAGCVKKDFDKPPVGTLPVGDIYTIEDMRQMYADSGGIQISYDASIYGTVTADESSGNLYKNIYFQDHTDAVNLHLNASGGFRTGDSIRVYMKGIVLNEYGGVFQLDNVSSDSNQVIIANQKYLDPKVVTIPELETGDFESYLIKLENVQFTNLDLGLTWADPDDYGERILEDCDGNTTMVRTSSYANFGDFTIPEGNGSIIAIAGSFNGTIQLMVRTITEVDMNGERCDGTGGGWEPNSTIPEIKAIYTGSRVQITDSKVIQATVIADDQSGNYYKTIVIQDDEGGIELKINDYDLYQQFPIGTKINVNCQGLYLDEYGGVVQLGSVYDDSGEEKFGGIQPDQLSLHVEKVTGGTPVDPTVVEINALTDDLIGMLVQFNGVEFIDADLSKTYAQPDPPYSENRTLSDCDDNQITVRTSGYADFAGEQVAQGNGVFVGVLSSYNGSYQLLIRDLTDLDMSGERCDGGGGGEPIPPVESLNEQFNDAENYTDINIAGWTNKFVEGTRLWQGKTFDNDKYAQATGYNSGLDAMEIWLITPPVINTSGDKKLSFKNAMAYWEHSGQPLTVLASTDYDGTNFETANWSALSPTLATSSDENYAWIESGEISLDGFVGNVAIAFKYIGSDTESTSIQIDDVVVSGGGGGNDGVTSIDEDFESLNNYDEVNLPGWLNLMTEGSRSWQAKEFDDDVYAQATSYNSGEDNTTYLITPKMDLAAMTNPVFEFDNAQAYWAHDGFSVLISTDFNGSDPESATWEVIDCNLAGQSTPDHEWVNSGVIDLSGYSSPAYIAFKYVGSDPNETTSYRVDNVKLYEE